MYTYGWMMFRMIFTPNYPISCGLMSSIPTCMQLVFPSHTPKKWYMLCGSILPCKAAMAAMGRVQFFSLVATKNLHRHNERNDSQGRSDLPWDPSMFSGMLINCEYPGTTSPTLHFDSHHDYRGHVIRVRRSVVFRTTVGLPGCRFVELRGADMGLARSISSQENNKSDEHMAI